MAVGECWGVAALLDVFSCERRSLEVELPSSSVLLSVPNKSPLLVCGSTADCARRRPSSSSAASSGTLSWETAGSFVIDTLFRTLLAWPLRALSLPAEAVERADVDAWLPRRSNLDRALVSRVFRSIRAR